MRITRLPGIHYDVNASLICGDESNIMVDVGTSWYQLLLLERLYGKLGDDVKLDGIILTCRRYNHTGGAAFLKKELGTTVYAHPNASQALSTGDFFTTWANRFDSDMPPVDTEPIIDAQKFQIGDGEIEIVEFPGHSNDSIGVWQAERGVLISGPTIPRIDSPARWDQPTGCLTDLRDSVARILDLEADMLIPAHGETIKGAKLIADVLQVHLNFLEEIVEGKGVMPKSWPRPSQTCNYLSPRPAWATFETDAG